MRGEKNVKKTAFLLCAAVALSAFSFPAAADIGVGYEALTILPHAFTIYFREKELGWGAKISADFGSSALSATAKVAGAIVTLGFGGFDSVNFYTASLTRDLSGDEITRSYLKFGAMVFQGESSGEIKYAYAPNLGYGWEWEEGLFGLTTSIEMGFPL